MIIQRYFVSFLLIAVLSMGVLSYAIWGATSNPRIFVNSRTYEILESKLENVGEYGLMSIYVKRGPNAPVRASAESDYEAFCAGLYELLPEFIGSNTSLSQLIWVKVYSMNRETGKYDSEPDLISYEGNECREVGQFRMPEPHSNWEFISVSPRKFVQSSRTLIVGFAWDGEGEPDFDRFDYINACEVIVEYSLYWIKKNIDRYDAITLRLVPFQIIEGVDPDQLPYAERQFLATDSGCEAIEMEEA